MNAAQLRRAGRRIDFAAADRRYRQKPFHELTAERIFQRRRTICRRAILAPRGSSRTARTPDG
ncbi:MAG: hypothetical protein ACYTG0_34100 [Planctomycetota bacterium]